MTESHRNRERQLTRREAQVLLEQDWLVPNDAHLAEFAQSIGAAIESNPFGYPLRRLVTHHRHGMTREICVTPWQGQGIHVDTGVALTCDGKTEQTGERRGETRGHIFDIRY